MERDVQNAEAYGFPKNSVSNNGGSLFAMKNGFYCIALNIYLVAGISWMAGFTAVALSDDLGSNGLAERLKRANEIVFYEPQRTRADSENGVVKYLPLTNGVIADHEMVEKLAVLIQQGESNADYPFIGHLAHVVFLDKDKEPLIIADIVLYKNTVVINKCGKINGVIIWDGKTPEYSDRLAVIRSPVFVREIFNHMKKEMPSEIEYLTDYYRRRCGENLEELLFFGRTSREASPQGQTVK